MAETPASDAPMFTRADVDALCDRLSRMEAVRLPELLRAAAMLVELRDGGRIMPEWGGVDAPSAREALGGIYRWPEPLRGAMERAP